MLWHKVRTDQSYYTIVHNARSYIAPIRVVGATRKFTNAKILNQYYSHVGIKGNEKADELAKQALNFNVLDLKVPYTECFIDNFVMIFVIYTWFILHFVFFVVCCILLWSLF